MTLYDLPETVTVAGQKIAVRTDFRAAIDMITALSDADLTEADKVVVLLGIFYRDPFPAEAIEEALERCLWFLSGGESPETGQRGPKLMDWEQDFRWIAAPITKALGRDVRSGPMHWWTFLSYYYEIGDCTFAQIVGIRRKLQSGKPLDKAERRFYAQNRNMVNLQNKYTATEDALIASITGKEAGHG